LADHGMFRYWKHRDEQDPVHILLYEQWADRADFDASTNADWRARPTTPIPSLCGRASAP
jgi:quinol monooxygenase YgiN